MSYYRPYLFAVDPQSPVIVGGVAVTIDSLRPFFDDGTSSVSNLMAVNNPELDLHSLAMARKAAPKVHVAGMGDKLIPVTLNMLTPKKLEIVVQAKYQMKAKPKKKKPAAPQKPAVEEEE